ncbi:Crp/Fnr family transcriptional regulator [Paenibacillus thermotolerans]|uniref:Crp/Fnr family transcriptional regulator n=1 Tax=Paenibacillus thermotolerans TaxID=3027807 RepID=UPI0023683B80|nr:MULTISPECIES: Crp/Fnr family transcriptional regulator [unclassified Paenibacillus]
MHDITKLLKNVPILEDFDSEELAAIAPLFKERTFKKGTILFFEGDPGEELFVISTGFVKIYRLEQTLDQTKEITLSLFRDGDFFGEMALIESGATRSATAETIDATTVFTLSRNDFAQFLVRSPKLCLKLLGVTMKRLRKANDKIHDLTFLDVRSRIIKNIERLSTEYGVKVPEGTRIDLKLTHQQIANMVGTVRESVTKVLQELQDDGIISVDKKRIIIMDPVRLSKSIQF